MQENSQVEISYSNFLSSKHGIATAVENFKGKILVQESLFKNSHSSGLILWGGETTLGRVTFEGGLGGIVAKRTSILNLDTVDFSGMELYGLDVFDKVQLSMQNSLVENSGESAVRATKFSGQLKILNSSLNGNLTAFSAQESRNLTIAGVELMDNRKEAVFLQDSDLHCIGVRITRSPVPFRLINSTVKKDKCQ